MRCRLPSLALLVGALALAACGAGHDEGAFEVVASSATATPTPTATFSPTPECDEKCEWRKNSPIPTPTLAPPAAVYPEGTRTGDAEVDAILAAIEAQDSARLASLIQLTSFPCGPDRPIQPQVDRCPEGEPVGTMLTGVWVTHVEGGLWRVTEAEMASRILSVATERGWKLHSVYSHIRSGMQDEWMPETDYFITFATYSPHAGPEHDNLRVVDGRIVGLHFAFGEPYRAWDNPADPGWLLPRAK